MARKKEKKTSDAVAIIDRHFIKDRPKRQEQLAKTRANEAVGRKLYALRTEAGLSQRELARLVGTTASVICRLEDADYRGHSLAMLYRIADVLKKEVRIEFLAKRSAA